jgi:Domain of Unknown Function (DUF1080)
MRSHTSFGLPLVLIALMLLSTKLSAADDAAGWKPLFNGKDLTGWTAIDGPLADWHATDGVLSCGGGSGKGWLSTTEQYKNFELELEFRVPPGGNSGVFLRAPHEGNPAFDGMEIQVLDDPAPEYATIKPAQHCGSLYGLAAAKSGALKKAGEWQKYLIVCDGKHVKVTLNGQGIVDANLADFESDETHKGARRAEGFVGLQNHGTQVDFRNIRIRNLP